MTTYGKQAALGGGPGPQTPQHRSAAPCPQIHPHWFLFASSYSIAAVPAGSCCSSRVTEPAESWLQQQSYRACRELVAAAELQSLQRVGCSAELQSLQRVGCSSRVQATRRVGVETAHLGLARRGRQGRRNNASSGLGRRLHSWMGHRAMGAMLIQQDRLT
jgi:hypothetical protein